MADTENTIVPGTPEYDAAMISKSESVVINGQAGTQPEGGDPASTGQTGSEEKLLAGQFKTVEELEAAYQAALAGKKPEGEATDGDTQKTEGNREVTEEEVKNATVDQAGETLKSVGLNMEDFSAEFSTSGELSENSYKKLADAGIPKEMVDAYIDGQMAKAELAVEKVTSVVGGRESYNRMIEWARVNLSSDEIAAFDRTVTSGDLSVAQLASEGLYRRYTSAVGTNNRQITGSTNGQVTDVFQSTAQVTAAMRDARYRNDPAYRQAIAEKISRSNIF